MIEAVQQEAGSGEWHLITGRECTIELARRPRYCDRGAWIATLDAWGELGLSIDHADAWPRYYFDFDRALLEIEAWMVKRRQVVE